MSETQEIIGKFRVVKIAIGELILGDWLFTGASIAHIPCMIAKNNTDGAKPLVDLLNDESGKCQVCKGTPSKAIMILHKLQRMAQPINQVEEEEDEV